jgi:uncharacterized protein
MSETHARTPIAGHELFIRTCVDCGVTARLIVSLSGLSDDAPEPLAAAAGFAARLDSRGVPLSQLVRPRGPVGSPIPDSRLVRWLQERRSAGDAVVLHGYDHRRNPVGARQLRGRRAEFAALPRHEAGLRLIAARRALAEFSLRTDVFAPPRWLASPGTVKALREQGFRVLADETGIRFLRLPEPSDLVRSRVLGFRAVGDHERAVGEAWRCRVLIAEVSRTVRRGGLVRINVRAKDLRHPARRDAVLVAVDGALALGAVPDTYRLPARPAAAA